MMSVTIPNAEEIKAAFAKLDAEARARIREEVGVDQGLWSKIVNAKKQAGAAMSVSIDRATKGTVPAHLLRPDVFEGLVLKNVSVKDTVKVSEEVTVKKE